MGAIREASGISRLLGAAKLQSASVADNPHYTAAKVVHVGCEPAQVTTDIGLLTTYNVSVTYLLFSASVRLSGSAEVASRLSMA